MRNLWHDFQLCWVLVNPHGFNLILWTVEKSCQDCIFSLLQLESGSKLLGLYLHSRSGCPCPLPLDGIAFNRVAAFSDCCYPWSSGMDYPPSRVFRGGQSDPINLGIAKDISVTNIRHFWKRVICSTAW